MLKFDSDLYLSHSNGAVSCQITFNVGPDWRSESKEEFVKILDSKWLEVRATLLAAVIEDDNTEL
jgi:hypothetical protein